MKRRDFIKTIAAAGFGVTVYRVLPGWALARGLEPSKKEKYWAWIMVDTETPDAVWKERFATIRKAGIDAILPEVYDSRLAYYQSAHLPKGNLWLEQILPLAKAEGLEVHAWMHTMQCNVPEIYKQHPEWYVVNRKGDSAADKPAYVRHYRFLCPSRPEVQEFVRTTVVELSKIDGLDGVHLDYVRYPDVILPVGLWAKYGIVQDKEYPEYDYCYCQVCREAFKKETGVDPLKLEDPAANQAWKQWRQDRITHLVNDMLVPAAHAGKKVITAAVFPNWEHVRQEWPRWKLDGALPMLYNNFYGKGVDWIGEQTAQEVKSQVYPKPIYSGIFVPGLSPEELTRAMESAAAGGASGVVLFSAGSMTEEDWKTFSEGVRARAGQD